MVAGSERCFLLRPAPPKSGAAKGGEVKSIASGYIGVGLVGWIDSFLCFLV